MQISKGNYPGNRDLMEHYLKILEKEIAPVASSSSIELAPNVIVHHPPETKEPTKAETTHPGQATAQFSNLNKEITQGLHKRMQLSQSFHDCKTDYERSVVCDAIDAQNALLSQLNHKKEYFERHGEMPIDEETDFELATTDDSLAIQQNRKQSYKAKLLRQINDMLLYEEGHPKRKKLYEKQMKYKEVIAELEMIKNARKEIKSR